MEEICEKLINCSHSTATATGITCITLGDALIFPQLFENYAILQVLRIFGEFLGSFVYPQFLISLRRHFLVYKMSKASQVSDSVTSTVVRWSTNLIKYPNPNVCLFNLELVAYFVSVIGRVDGSCDSLMRFAFCCVFSLTVYVGVLKAGEWILLQDIDGPEH